MIRAYWNVLLIAPDGAVERANTTLLSWSKAESLAAMLRASGADAMAARALTERSSSGNA